VCNSCGMPGRPEGNGPPVRTGVSPAGVAGRAIVAVLLFCIPALAGLMADGLFATPTVGSEVVMWVLLVVTIAFALMHAVVLLAANGAPLTRSWQVLPYGAPLAVLAVVSGLMAWREVSVATAVAAMVGSVGWDIIWAVAALRGNARPTPSRGP
jgi:hypothetical protein